jgi:hypothetical protein
VACSLRLEASLWHGGDGAQRRNPKELILPPNSTDMKALELPPTIRTARADEVTPNEEVLKRLEARAATTLREGYTMKHNPTTEVPFRFFSEINIDNSRLWALFTALAARMPSELSLIYGHIDEEPVYGRYLPKQELLDQLTAYQLELTQDGMQETGLIYQDEGRLEEVFIRKAKYLQFWGVDEAAFRQVMQAFGLEQVQDLSFIDDFPLATEPLKYHHPAAKDTDEVLQELKSIVSDE